MNKKWTDQDKDLIKQLAVTTKDKDMPDKIKALLGKDVTFAAYRKLRQRLGIKK